MTVMNANCPKCRSQISVEEADAEQPITCSSCQSVFVPAKVIAESNERFQFWMYAGMFLLGAGLILYMVVTGNGLPKADAPAAPAEVEAGAVDQ